jgi:predicted Zn finger-like uncharacterized protein
MLVVCPNCATPYGVEMASVRPSRGSTRQLRCHHCRWTWQAEISHADKLVIAAEAVAPVRWAMAAARELGRGARSGDRATARSLHAFATASARLRRLIATLGACWDAQSSQKHSDNRWARLWHNRWRQAAPVPVSRLQVIILVLVLLDAGIIGGRNALVWAMPQTASFYAQLGLLVNVRGVQFARMTAAAERHDGSPVLVVRGEISNKTRTIEALPDLHFAVRNLERQEIHSWTDTPARRSLAPGEALVFRTELALPPPDTRDVVVRFVDRDDNL